jgi:low affinity Fe/Cu permease
MAAEKTSKFSGGTPAFIIALSSIIIWGLTGPLFSFSDTWQLVINTGTTIITFLMVFLIQRSQNKDSIALHLKLNEIVASLPDASNRLISVEDLNEKELEILRNYYELLSQRTKKETNLNKTHSIEEAHRNIDKKLQRFQVIDKKK